MALRPGREARAQRSREGMMAALMRRQAAPGPWHCAGALLLMAALGLWFAGASTVQAHGNVTPQPVDTQGLPKVQGPLMENPYRGTPAYAHAVDIGSSAFNQNCARCHGLEAISGGIAPDLRHLPKGKEGDVIFQQRIRNGSIRNGVTYMPPFKDIFSEEAIWAIRSYLDSRFDQNG